ncbi:MAG: hypothetical protein IJU53_02495, partial [Thermoguttaceae bacterium]|nr:hypothetical protein [Thermoguttaceae bacterium]
ADGSTASARVGIAGFFILNAYGDDASSVVLKIFDDAGSVIPASFIFEATLEASSPQIISFQFSGN